MFSILLGFLDAPTQEYLRELCNNCGQISVSHANTQEEWSALFKQQEFDCFFFRFEEDLMTVRNVIYDLRKNEQHKHTPIILFSTKIEYLITAFVHWRSCECFLLPFDNEKKEALSSLLHYYVGMYQKMHLVQNKFCRITTPKEIYNLLYSDILYVESTMKKSIIHMKNDAIHVPLPLYQVRRMIDDDNFVQTHRSFIVNLENISYVDKSKEPWGIFFFDSDKEAFVSRSHKKTLPLFFQGPDD